MLARDRKAWDAKVAAQWPAEWEKANLPPRASKKRANLRKRFIAVWQHERFVEENPNASCANCRFNVAHPNDKKYPHICDLGWEKGGWFQPIELTGVCKSWEAEK